MSKDLREGNQLLIVSDTRAYLTDSGEMAVFEPTLREIEYVSNYMDKIVWILFLCEGLPPKSYRPSLTNKIEIVSLQFSGGDSIKAKMNVLRKSISYFRIIHRSIKKFDLIHTRGPSVPAWIAILLSFFYKRKKFWNKYAGNWYQENPPGMYGLQIRLLKRAKHTRVTINGFPDPKRKHIIALENPCFSDEEFRVASQAIHEKKYSGPYNLLFVGRIETEKGIFRLIGAVSSYPDHSVFDHIYFAGEGKDIKQAKEQAKHLLVPHTFLGSLNRQLLNKFYRRSHFLLLPSDSEGFPKVIAEAAAFGCIPVVSNISSIAKYVNNNNGYIWSNRDTTFKEFFNTIPFGSEQELKEKAMESVKIAQRFTYDNYWGKLKREVFS